MEWKQIGTVGFMLASVWGARAVTTDRSHEWAHELCVSQLAPDPVPSSSRRKPASLGTTHSQTHRTTEKGGQRGPLRPRATNKTPQKCSCACAPVLCSSQEQQPGRSLTSAELK